MTTHTPDYEQRIRNEISRREWLARYYAEADTPDRHHESVTCQGNQDSLRNARARLYALVGVSTTVVVGE